MDELQKCEICKEEVGIGVASSSLGAVSICWGQRCLDENAEPLWAVNNILEMVNYDISKVKQELADETKVYLNGEYITVREYVKRRKV